MSAATHTPGPWLAGRPSSIVGWPVVAPAAMGRSICDIAFTPQSAYGDRSEIDAFNAESEANVRLIAAAPDLLEALKDLVQLEGGRFGTGVIKPGTYGAAVMGAARAAIAKAEVAA